MNSAKSMCRSLKRREAERHFLFPVSYFLFPRKAFRFTLIEIIMVIALIAVLTGIAVGGYSYANGAAKEAATKAIIKQLEAALESCKVKHGFYPSGITKFKLTGANGAEIEDEALVSDWGNIPYKYIKDFRKALDMESLREYLNSDGEICDAWGELLIYSAPFTDPGNSSKKYSFTIYSAGPDGDKATTEDNIYNYSM